MWLLLAVLGIAEAGVQPGVLQVGATPMAAGEGYAGVLLGGFAGAGRGAQISGGIRVGFAPHDTVAFSFVGGFASTVGMLGSVRGTFLEREGFRLAALGYGGLTDDGDIGWGAGAGLAFEAGSGRVWVDGSLPLLGFAGIGGSSDLTVLPTLWDAGVRLEVGEEHRHRFRVGLVGLLGTAGWRYQAPGWFAGAHIVGDLVASNTLYLEGGVRF